MDYGPDWRQALRAAHERLVATHAGTEDKPAADALFRAAMSANDRTEAIALLAALARIAPLGVAATVRVGSAKGLVSVAWKAGLSPELAAEAQRWLGRIPPGDVLRAGDDGGWPLDEATMDWQVEMAAEAKL